MKQILCLLVICAAFFVASIAHADPKMVKAWSVYDVSEPATHLEVGDFFTIKKAGNNLKVLPGSRMENRGWGRDGYVLHKVGKKDIYCLPMMDRVHDRADEETPHLYVFYLDPVAENELIIRFGYDYLADTCEATANHGGLAHAEGSR